MDSGTTDSGTSMPTMLSATGALVGSISAPKPIIGYDTASSFVLKKTTGTLAFTVDINIGFAGMPMNGSFAAGTDGFTCDATIASGTTSADTWVTKQNLGGTPAGSCELTLAGVTLGSSGYTATGNLKVTAQAMGGASSGTVTVMGTF